MNHADPRKIAALRVLPLVTAGSGLAALDALIGFVSIGGGWRGPYVVILQAALCVAALVLYARAAVVFFRVRRGQS